MLNAGTLIHGGIMVNYQCSAACRHCLYSCSPTRGSGYTVEAEQPPNNPSSRARPEGAYVDEASAENICRYLSKGDCRSVHIGGGEPFLDVDGLVMVIRKLRQTGIKLEYIETNAYWAFDASAKKTAKENLERLLAEGASTLCISVDPFHAEYVPYGAPLALAELCDKTGMEYFLWKREFLPTLSRLDSRKTHTRAEMEKALSRDYIHKTARLYGIGYGGRAINIEREYGVLYPAEHFVAGKTSGEASSCHNLLSTGHFHVDMHAYFIPPRCTGIRIPLSEAVEGIPAGKYPVFEALYSGGVGALMRLAQEHGFSPGGADYPSKCSLCFRIRHFHADKNFAELDKDHYEESLKYY